MEHRSFTARSGAEWDISHYKSVRTTHAFVYYTRGISTEVRNPKQMSMAIKMEDGVSIVVTDQRLAPRLTLVAAQYRKPTVKFGPLYGHAHVVYSPPILCQSIGAKIQ